MTWPARLTGSWNRKINYVRHHLDTLEKNRLHPSLLEGLRRLEYRGYDSAGVAIVWMTPTCWFAKKRARLMKALLRDDSESPARPRQAPASATPVGPPMACPATRIPIRISMLPAASPSSIMASLKTTRTLKQRLVKAGHKFLFQHRYRGPRPSHRRILRQTSRWVKTANPSR